MGEKKKFLEGAIKFGVFMGDDVVPQTTIKELKELLKEKTDDSTFADVYTVVLTIIFFIVTLSAALKAQKLVSLMPSPRKNGKNGCIFIGNC